MVFFLFGFRKPPISPKIGISRFSCQTKKILNLAVQSRFASPPLRLKTIPDNLPAVDSEFARSNVRRVHRAVFLIIND